MKIIKDGRSTQEITCIHCKSILEVNDGDIIVSRYVVTEDLVTCVKCPCCKRYIAVNKSIKD